MPCSSKIVALGHYSRGTGALNVYDVGEKEFQPIASKEYRMPLKAGTFGASNVDSGRLFATIDFEGRANLWNLEKMDVPIWTNRASEQVLQCIDAAGGDSDGPQEIVVGGKDGNVKLFDLREKNPVFTLAHPASKLVSAPQIWSVALGNCQNGRRNLAIGTEAGHLLIYDLRMQREKFSETLSGIAGLQYSDKTNSQNLVATCVGGKVISFDFGKSESNWETQLEKVKQTRPTDYVALDPSSRSECHDFKTTAWFVRHQPYGSSDHFLVGTGDGTLGLYHHQRAPQKGSTCKLVEKVSMSNQPILCGDWNRDFPGLACVGCLDGHLRCLFVDS